MSSCYLQLSGSRKKILGTWHDPQSQSDYISVLKKQGSKVIAMDFTAMDTYITKHHVSHIASECIRLGMEPIGFGILKALINNMSLIVPSFSNDATSTLISNYIPWPSGLKTTSEVDSIIGQAIPLACLMRQKPDLVKKWSSGNFIILNQGDDVLFTHSDALNYDQIEKDALEFGFALKVEPNNSMFLKTLMPFKAPYFDKARPWSRVWQQTFFNEDSYDGKPDAIPKIGLISRLAGITNNPLTPALGPDFIKIVSSLKWFESMSNEQIADLKKHYTFSLNADDNAEILKYSLSNKTWLSEMIARSKFEPSAANFLAAFLSLKGTDKLVDQEVTYSQAVRKVIRQALYQTPRTKDIDFMFTLINYKQNI